MIINGRIWKDGKWWLAESEVVDIHTQGKTRTEAIEMLVDAFETMIDRPDVRIAVTASGRDGDALVSIEANDPAAFAAFVLHRVRERSGRSLAEVASTMGKASKNAYARYEQGEAVPTIQKFEELLSAVDPDLTVCVASRTGLVRGPFAKEASMDDVEKASSHVYSLFRYELDAKGDVRQVRAGEATPFSSARKGQDSSRSPVAASSNRKRAATKPRKRARKPRSTSVEPST